MGTIRPLSDVQRELVVGHLRLPVGVVHRWFWTWLPEYGDDLIGTGNVALCVAAATFDPGRKCSFKTWAKRGIRDAVRDEVRRIIRRKRVPEELRDGCEWQRERDRAADVEHVRARLSAVISTLTPNEWMVAGSVCGFSGDALTQSELAAACGVSRQAVNETAKRAVAKAAEVLGQSVNHR